MIFRNAFQVKIVIKHRLLRKDLLTRSQHDTECGEKVNFFQANYNRGCYFLGFEKRFNSIGKHNAVVARQAVVGISFLVILQEGGEFTPGPVARSAVVRHHGVCGCVLSSEPEAIAGQLCDMIFSVAGFDLNGPMEFGVGTDVDFPR